MAWGFTPEWLAERERRKKLKALGSTGPVKADTVIGNCELVTLSAVAADVDRPRSSKPVQSGSTPDGRSTPQCRADASAPDRPSLRSVASSAAPIPYPLVRLCRMARIAEPVPEYPFGKNIGRRWRFDYAWPLAMLACEIEGGLWTQGRHSRGSGAVKDLEKYSEAAIAGWRLIYATPQELDNGVCLDRVARALTDRCAA